MMDTAFLIIWFEVFAGHIVTESRVVLLGDRVEMDCIANTSQPRNWFLNCFGSNDYELIAVNSNISDAFSIISEDSGRYTLVIDPVGTTLAGGYRCIDTNKEYELTVEVTVLDPYPNCEKSAASLSNTVECHFRYAGNLAPELELLTQESNVLSVSCKAYNASVYCTYDSFCPTNNQSSNITDLIREEPFEFNICSGDHSPCKWDTDKGSPKVGTLQVKTYNMTVGGWQCDSTQSATTSAFQTTIFLPIIAGVISMATVLLLLVLQRKCGVCPMKRTPPDVQVEPVIEKYSGSNEGTLSKPHPYDERDGNRGPQPSSNPDIIQQGYQMDDFPKRSSAVYSSAGTRERPYIVDDGLTYSEMHLDNNPLSRQPLKPSEQSNYADIGFA